MSYEGIFSIYIYIYMIPARGPQTGVSPSMEMHYPGIAGDRLPFYGHLSPAG